MVFSALDELEFGSLRAFFETKVLEVGTLSTIII